MTKNNEENIVAAGCFPAGTKINTPIGYRLIENIQVGDEVYAFSLANRMPGMPDEQPGQVFVKKVTETFKHFHGVVGETTKLLKITYHGEPEHGYVHDGELVVSGNHYILTPSKQSEETDAGFARADVLEVGDVMWTEYGDEVIITSIEDGGEYDFVYNFEVEDCHTYIAGGIRVHNGGGGKGKKGAPKQSPNSVQVKQTIRVLLSPGEGEIGGLYNEADPAQSVFFNGTPLRNSDGSYNFDNIAVTERTGLPDQTVIPGFSAVEAEILVGQPLTAASPITRTVSSADIDAVRVTLEFTNGLQKINTENGDANGTSVSFTVQRRVQGGTWETVLSPTVKEMSSGPFAVSGLLQRPASPGVWEFRVNRTTPDTNLNNIIDKVSLDSYTEIQNVNIAYNNRALVAIAVGADSTNGTIPAIALDLMGKLVKVPSNYNPVNRSYTGSWNGQFAPTLQWTNNPAWVIYDLLQHERYGLAAYGFDASRIDIYSFYEAARYCDELVPTAIGSGKFEPRFTFDAQLMVRESAFHTLNTIASTMNAKLYEHNGFIRIAQDRPATVERLISNSNVVDGLFIYSTSSVEETYTQVNVTYSDPNSNFLPTTVSEVASVADRARFDHNVTDLAAYGATSEGQARRAAKWVLDTSLRQVELVNFAVSLENAAFEPNEIFYLMDKDYSQTTQEGRLLGNTGTTLILDKALVMPAGGTWTISIYSANGETIEERTITNRGTTASINVNATVNSPPGSVYIVTGAVKPRQFRLVSMVDNVDGTYTVKAVQHDPNKYARVEQGIIVPDEVYWQNPPLNAVDTPTNLVVQPVTAVNADGQVYRQMNVSWTPPADGTAVSYLFQWRRNGQPLTEERPTNAFAIIPSDFSGLYEFYVNAVNTAGVTSPTLAGTYDFNFEGGGEGNVDAITGLRLANGATFYSGAMSVVWNKPVNGQVKNYHVYLSTPDGTRFKEFDVQDTGFTYTYDQNVADGGPRSAIQVTVFARDMNNNLGPGLAATFSSQPSAGITNLQVRGGGTVFDTLDLDVEWQSRSSSGQEYFADPDFGYFNVQVRKDGQLSRSEQVTTANYTYTFNANVKDNGQDTPSNEIEIVVTAYNRLGVASASASATFTPVAPPVVTNLYTKGRSDTIFAEEDLQVVWLANLPNGSPFSASNQFKHFEIKVYSEDALKRTIKEYGEYFVYTAEMNALDNGNPVPNVRLEVRSVSVYNLTSAPAEATFTNPPPALPNNIQITSGIGNYKIYFDRHVDWDVEGTFVWADTTPNIVPSAQNLVATMTGNYLSINAEPGVRWYVRIAPFDSFRRNNVNGEDLNISTEVGVTGEAAGILSLPEPPDPAKAKPGDVYIDISDPENPILKKFNGTAWVNAIAAQDFPDGTIPGTKIEDGGIQTPQLDANAVTAINLAADAVIARNIKAGEVSTDHMKVNSILGDRITVNTLVGDRIKVGTLDGDVLIANSVDAIKIDTRGLTIKDMTGKVIFGAGTPVDLSVLPDDVKNANVTPALIGAIGLGNKLTASNISTYINAAAIDQAYIGTISASKIDTRGLTIKDANGNIIFGSGTSVPLNLIPSGALNSNVTPAGIGAVSTNLTNAPAGILNSNVTPAGIGAVGTNNKITAANISTYMANAAIGGTIIANNSINTNHVQANSISGDQLQVNAVSAKNIAANSITVDKLAAGALTVGNGTITNAKIANAAIDTLKIQGNAVTVPISSYTAGVITASSETGVQDARMVISASDLSGVSSINILAMFGCHCYSNYHQALTMSLDVAREYDANGNYAFGGFTRIFSLGGGNNTTQMQGEGMETGQLSHRVTQAGTYLFRLQIASPGNTAWASRRYITLLQAKR